MGQYRRIEALISPVSLQEVINASDVIEPSEYDVPKDRVYASTLVAHVFNIDPAAAVTGVSLDLFLARVHPEDREHFLSEIKSSTETGLCCTFECRVCSADGSVRWVLDRGRIALGGVDGLMPTGFPSRRIDDS